MTTKMEKKMIGSFYKLTEEKVKWEKDLIASNHRNLDLQYIIDEQDSKIVTLELAINAAIACIKKQPITVIADTIWYNDHETLCDMLASVVGD